MKRDFYFKQDEDLKVGEVGEHVKREELVY